MVLMYLYYGSIVFIVRYCSARACTYDFLLWFCTCSTTISARVCTYEFCAPPKLSIMELTGDSNYIWNIMRGQTALPFHHPNCPNAISNHPKCPSLPGRKVLILPLGRGQGLSGPIATTIVAILVDQARKSGDSARRATVHTPVAARC